MRLSPLTLCLTLLASSVGFAQAPEEWTPYTTPPAETPSSPPLVPAPAPAPTEESAPPVAPTQPPPPPGELIPRRLEPEDQLAMRLVVTPWAGVVTGMMGVIVGVVPSAIIALPFCVGAQELDEPRCAITAIMGLALSYSVGASVGISFTGGVLGGRGDFVLTLLGSIAGAALGAGIGIATRSTEGMILALSICPLIGAVVGYEVSHSQAFGLEGVQLAPVFGATLRGGILGGIAGRF